MLGELVEKARGAHHLVLKMAGCRVSRSSVVTISTFSVAVKSGKAAVPDSAGGGGIRDCF
jgi:hypothetical protein